MAKWTIRRAKPDDAIALATCIEEAYAKYVERIPDLPAVSEGILDDIKDNLVWVAARGGGIIGGMVMIQKADHLILANVAVSPNATGIGLGRAFLDLAEAQSHALDVGELRLSTHVEMPENVRLYQHLGWHETARSDRKVHMAKSTRS